jgi:hypothetical protein
MVAMSISFDHELETTITPASILSRGFIKIENYSNFLKTS